MTMTNILTPNDITPDSYYTVVTDLMHAQARYASQYLLDEVCRWDANFISDDGTDYMDTCLTAMQTLIGLRYEGTPQDLIDFLFTSREAYDGVANDPERFHFGPPLHYIDSAGGLCDELNAYSNALNEEA